MKLYVLRVGTVEVDVAKFMAMEPERGERYAGPVTAFLVCADNGRNVLIDTGLAPEHVQDPRARIPPPDVVVDMRAEDDIRHQLARLGLKPGDVESVVITHFDFDHCGGNRLFPHAEFYVQRDHYDWARNTDFPWRVDWDFASARFKLIDGDQDLFGDIRAVRTPGHLPGHQSVVVGLPNTGAVILTGDAAFTHVMFEEERVTGTPDPPRVLESIRRLKQIRDEEQATVLVSHDVDRVYREPPEYYD